MNQNSNTEIRHAIADRSKDKFTAIAHTPLPFGGDGGLTVGPTTSLPDPVISHPSPEQSRLHQVPSQCILQFPPGQDITQHICTRLTVHITISLGACLRALLGLAPHIGTVAAAMLRTIVSCARELGTVSSGA